MNVDYMSSATLGMLPSRVRLPAPWFDQKRKPMLACKYFRLRCSRCHNGRGEGKTVVDGKPPTEPLVARCLGCEAVAAQKSVFPSGRRSLYSARKATSSSRQGITRSGLSRARISENRRSNAVGAAMVSGVRYTASKSKREMPVGTLFVATSSTSERRSARASRTLCPTRLPPEISKMSVSPT